MRSASIVMCGILTLSVVAACSSDKKKGDAAATDSIPMVTRTWKLDSLQRPVGRVRRMPTLMGRLRTERDSQMVSMELYSPPENFPIQFTTYKSADMQTSSMILNGAASLTFTPLLGTKLDPQTFMQVHTDTAAIPATDPIDATLESITTGRKVSGQTITKLDGYPWATAAASYSYTLEGRKLQGTVILGRRGTHTFRIVTQYPADLADMMAPRIDLILKQWRWDDYTYLIPA
jgi:hypothetical protein